MATLLDSSFVPKTKVDFTAPYETWNKRMEEEWNEINNEGLGVVQFPRGDGHDVYIVRSMQPLKLQHVQTGDNWQVDYATIRGLKKEEVALMMG